MTCSAVKCRHAIDTHKNYLTSNVKSVFFYKHVGPCEKETQLFEQKVISISSMCHKVNTERVCVETWKIAHFFMVEVDVKNFN